MSTKKIREVLTRIAENPAAASDPLVQGAFAEVEAIEKAAREWVEDKPSIASHEVLERIAEESQS